MRPLLATALLAALPAAAYASDADLANRLVDASFNHGQVVQIAAHLTDGIGARLTNSPAMREAERWTQAQYRAWGLSNVHTEGFEFGRGWWIESHTARMTAPRPLELRSIPVAWTPPTNGPITAEIVMAPMSEEKHFEAWRGKLAGKIVLVSLPTPATDQTAVPFTRLDGKAIAELDEYDIPNNDPDAIKPRLKRRAFAARLDAFLKAEGALAWARMSARPNGLLHGDGHGYKVGQTPQLPGVELAQEDYRRLARLAKVGPVSLTLDNQVHFDDSDTKAYNVFAEIPGSDPKAGYVMAGAHLDSWTAADGAADNAAGSAVVMEAARLLATQGVKPRRTVRFALWSGEEQGLHGSYAYVEKHLATRPPVTDPELAAGGPGVAGRISFPISKLPGYADMKLYLNMDNGGGKLRGLHAEGNVAAVPMLKGWLAPYAMLGAGTVVAGSTGSTDHVGLVKLGLPAYQFIQDPLDYSTLVHHSSVDTFDHLRPDDLRQAAAVLAGVLLSAANSDKEVPRNVVPGAAPDSDPFRYRDPETR